MAKLGEICEIQSGGTPARSNKSYWEKGTIPWAKISDFKGKYLTLTEEYISEAGLKKFFSKNFSFRNYFIYNFCNTRRSMYS